MAFTSEAPPLPVAYATAWSMERFINKQVAWSVKRFEVINKQVKNTPHRILFLGDSLQSSFRGTRRVSGTSICSRAVS